MQVARQRHDPGKGCYWAINPLHSQEKVQQFEKRKKPVVVAGLEPALLQRTLLQAAQCCRPGTAGLQHCQLPPPLPLLGTTQHTRSIKTDFEIHFWLFLYYINSDNQFNYPIKASICFKRLSPQQLKEVNT